MAMKWINKTFVLLICCISVCCGSPDEIEYSGGQSGALSDERVSIAYLRSLYRRAPILIENELYIVGRIVSTDEFGAFYKTLLLEDHSGGIALRIDIEDYHRVYFPGETFKVACNSLTISSYGGQLQLGVAGGEISEADLPMVLTRDFGEEEFAPLPLEIDSITPSHIQRWVSFDDVQFEEFGPWYAPDGRYVVDREGRRLNVRTSPHALFAAALLPAGSGYIEGVLSVFNGVYQLEVWSDRYAVMDKERFVVH